MIEKKIVIKDYESEDINTDFDRQSKQYLSIILTDKVTLYSEDFYDFVAIDLTPNEAIKLVNMLNVIIENGSTEI